MTNCSQYDTLPRRPFGNAAKEGNAAYGVTLTGNTTGLILNDCELRSPEHDTSLTLLFQRSRK